MREIADTDVADLHEAVDTAEIDRLARVLCEGAEDHVDAPAWSRAPGVRGMSCRWRCGAACASSGDTADPADRW